MRTNKEIIFEGYAAAKYAQAAYSDFDSLRTNLRQRNLYQPGDPLYNLTEESEDVEAYAHYSCDRQELWVFIRGTERLSHKDWVRDISLFPKKWQGYKGHRGMRNGAKEIYDALLPIMAKHPGDIIICGHSLGGGISTWLQIALKGAASAVHTFGSPRVLSYSSSKRFNSLMRDQHIRWVNGSDIVPRLLWWIYKHVGRMFFIDPGWDLLTNGAAEKSARYMRWRSIKSFGRKGFSEHSIEDYLMCIAHQCDQ